MMGSDDLLLEVEGVVDLHSIFSGRREDSKFEFPFAIPVAEGDFNINRLTNKRFQERVLGDARGINLNRASAIGHRIGRVATAALGNRALEGIDVQRDGVIGVLSNFFKSEMVLPVMKAEAGSSWLPNSLATSLALLRHCSPKL